MINLRPITKDDYSYIEKAEEKNPSFPDRLLIDSLMTFKSTAPMHYAITKDDRLIGVLVLKLKSKKHFFIEILYILHTERSKGYGESVIKLILEQQIIKLSAFAFSNRAEAWFYKLGFKGEPGQLLTYKKLNP